MGGGLSSGGGHFTRATNWLEVALLAVMTPLFVFPKPEWTWLFLVFPLLWTVRWALEKNGVGDSKSRTVVDVAILILCIQILVSTLMSGDVPASLPKIAGILYGIFVFYALVRLLRTDILIKAGVGVFIVGGIALASMGLVGMSKSREPFFAKAVNFLLEKIPQKNWGLKGAELGLNPNALAGVMMLFVPLCAVLAVWGLKKGAGRHLVSQRIDLVLFSVLTLYYGLILFLTQSIGSWLALVVCLWFVLPSWKAKAAGFVPIVVFVIIIMVLIPGKYGKAAAKQGQPLLNKKVEARFKFWNEGLEAVGERPFTGIGVNQLRMRPGFKYEYSHAHNQMLHTAAELGIPGLAAYLAILMGSGYMCLEIWRKAPAGWMRAAAQGLGAGQLAHFVFGLGDTIPLGAKPGIFFWVSLALISSIYNYSVNNKKIVQ
jgi:putative inorganic carbon (HCO3(-)) transporter